MPQHYQTDHKQQVKKYSLIDFTPLIIITFIICTITALHQWFYGVNIHNAMRIFMATFFLIFGLFKLVNLPRFVQAYEKYDLVTKKWKFYGYFYPFLEIGLGIAYLFSWNLYTINIITLIVMIVSAAGVFNQLHKGRQITCACLGDIFHVPMTYVTLVEDLLMALMAIGMLLI